MTTAAATAELNRTVPAALSPKRLGRRRLGMVGLAIGIAVNVESAYRLPGIGLSTLSGLYGASGINLPVIPGIVLVIGVVLVVVNLVVAWTHPRAARGGTRRSADGRIA